MARDADGKHFRGRPRPSRILPVHFAPVDDAGRPLSELQAVETRNIGVGGAFLAVETPPAVGVRVVIRLAPNLPDFRAEVRWVAQPPLERGCGLRFLPLDPPDLLALAAFLSGGDPSAVDSGPDGRE